MESGGSCSSPEIREKTHTEATENTEFTEKRKRNAGKENQSADRKAGIGWPRPRRENNRPRAARRRHGSHPQTRCPRLVRFPVTVDFPDLPHELFDALFFHVSCFRIDFPPQKLLLAQKLAAVFETRFIQRPSSHRRSHGASRLHFMPTIAEPALSRQRIDIGKSLRDTLGRIPQLQLAQTRRIH